MSVYFLTPDAGSGGDTITDGDDDDASLALGRRIVDQVSGGHPLGTADTVIFGQGTNTAEVDYADQHVIQPGRVLEPSENHNGPAGAGNLGNALHRLRGLVCR